MERLLTPTPRLSGCEVQDFLRLLRHWSSIFASCFLDLDPAFLKCSLLCSVCFSWQPVPSLWVLVLRGKTDLTGQQAVEGGTPCRLLLERTKRKALTRQGGQGCRGSAESRRVHTAFAHERAEERAEGVQKKCRFAAAAQATCPQHILLVLCLPRS